ncbi:MAG: flavodoxin family protein [Erysipelotrichia bacterium]|nr:flavodoxin family protein [Erysipelotrichia bacterium]NCC55094.1 flavodoxin family protein [Erysipelotrichia bacterium]
MHVLIIYTHPYKNSFTHQMKEAFIKGLKKANHTYEVSDLYAMHFNSDYSENDYKRDALLEDTYTISDDILQEQEKIQRADALVFIYPIFWSEAPAKLVGYFQRVWTKDFAYGENIEMKQLEKAIFLVSMGGNLDDEIHQK